MLFSRRRSQKVASKGGKRADNSMLQIFFKLHSFSLYNQESMITFQTR
jgi:hypothetical protein